MIAISRVSCIERPSRTWKIIHTIVNNGSYMSVRVLLNILNELRKAMKCETSLTFDHFFASLINSLIQEHKIFDSIYHVTLK